MVPMMKLDDDLTIIDLGLFFPKENALVLADIHIGYEEAMNRKGILVPRWQFNEMMKRLKAIFDMTGKVSRLIITGDLKHDFGTVSEQEWREILKFIDTAQTYAKEVIIIKGNHDKVLAPIAKKRNIAVQDYVVVGTTYICHGDVIPKDKDFKKAKRIIMGHEHPAISIHEGARVERFKCFLVGKYKTRQLIVLPSFFLATEGTDVLQEELLSPFLKIISGFRVLVPLHEVYDFGTVKKLLTISSKQKR